MKERWVRLTSLLVALIIHLLLLGGAIRQYGAVTTNPENANVVAQNLLRKKTDKTPYRFVYVKDQVPSEEPPLDPTRLSDLDRRGASPEEEAGDSPDPKSRGDSSTRTLGGPRGAPEAGGAPPRPATNIPAGMGPRQGSPRATPPPPQPSARPQIPRPPAAPAPAPGSGPPAGTGVRERSDRPGGQDQPPPGAMTTTELQVQAWKPETPGVPQVGGPQQPQLPSDTMSKMLERMHVGALEGGYENPNASRLNAGAVSFDTAAWDLGPYARQVQERVESNWRMPQAMAVLRQKGWVGIQFTVLKDGSIVNLAIERPSGIPSYDQSALNALVTSNPLPPLPEEVTVPEIRGRFRFFYNMPILEDEALE